MKKILVLVLILFSLALGYSFALPNSRVPKNKQIVSLSANKNLILSVGLVADSHDENGLLEKALYDAKNRGVDFVIGLGDYTNLGTVAELNDAKVVFDNSGLKYYLIPGDRDGWDSRNHEGVDLFSQFFGKATRVIDEKGITFILLDNSNIYKGISSQDWEFLKNALAGEDKLTLVFLHKTPFHPQSKHIMGEDSEAVAKQASDLNLLLAGSHVDGLFSGDIHFFAQFKDASGSVRISTIGAVASQRNFQGPRFGILNVYDDYSFSVDDVEIK